jgi:outer membrane protein
MVKASLVCMVLAIPTPGSAQAPTIPADARVAFVSVQRISTESAPGKAATSRVTALQQQKASELRAKQQAVQETRRLIAQATALEERTRLAAQEASQQADFERASAQAQADLQNLQREINVEMRPRVVKALDEILKGTHIEVVTNVDSTLVWAAPGLDLTNAVIERLNALPVAGPAGPGPVVPPAAPGSR